MKLSSKQTLQLLAIAQDAQRDTALDLDEVAFVTLMRICRDYVDPKRYPAVIDREKWFLDRLNKFRIRFFEKIEGYDVRIILRRLSAGVLPHRGRGRPPCGLPSEWMLHGSGMDGRRRIYDVRPLNQ